jgi:hypothetical protein
MTSSLFLGAETLGVITAACIKLYPSVIPRHCVHRRATRNRGIVAGLATRRAATLCDVVRIDPRIIDSPRHRASSIRSRRLASGICARLSFRAP